MAAWPCPFCSGPLLWHCRHDMCTWLVCDRCMVTIDAMTGRFFVRVSPRGLLP
jgi:hypothetical protein